MAETVVRFVVNKLCDAVLQEIFFLCGVKEKVEQVKRELIRIQFFLKDADRKQAGDERVKNWVKELRDMSHKIEDTVDLFALEVVESSGENSSPQKPSTKEKIKRWLKKPEKVVYIHKFGKEIDKILAQIGEISASREKYGIQKLGEGSGSEVAVPFKRPIIPDLDETELVGVNAEKEKIIEQLLDVKCSRRSVVSIVGPGGLGKSTVAEKAYSSNDVKSKFDVRIWLLISQNFTIVSLLKKMLKELGSYAPGDDDNDVAELMKEVKMSLRKKKYLIVMDDVWSEELWPRIAPALPDVDNGSRVLITSRFFNVPKAADPASEPNELRFLNDKESVQFLFKTALCNRDGTEGFKTIVLDIAKQLAHRCHGLPLALIVLGGLLSVKPLTYHAWENVSKTMVWSVDGQSVMDILASSYDAMSAELKSCFMYLACYPEDHKIDAQELIRLWVAEGLVPHVSGRILMEDTAQDYLEQLAQRSMVQVLERYPWGSIAKCGIHDLMRDLAIQKAKETNFLASCSSGDEEESCRVARRVAVHHEDCEVIKHANTNLRSFLNFDGEIQNISGHRLLQVLHIKKCRPSSAMERYDRLTQLRYLKLNSKLLQENSQQQYFLKSLGSLKYLQTLHGQSKLPLLDCIWHIKTLRHVLLFTVYAPQPGPPPSADLEFLQTLQRVTIPESWQSTTLPNLPNLRVLEIEKIKGSSWEVFVTFLHTLKHLEHLSVLYGEDIPLEFIDMRPFPFYHLLKSLSILFCKFSSNHMQIEAAMFPAHLTMLSMHQTYTTEHLMPELEKLHELRILNLTRYNYRTKKLRCTDGGFPHLEGLYIDLMVGVVWEIEEGAMPVLKNLTIKRSSPSQIIHGLENLTALRNLKWVDR